jgi:hypothetical protein
MSMQRLHQDRKPNDDQGPADTAPLYVREPSSHRVSLTERRDVMHGHPDSDELEDQHKGNGSDLYVSGVTRLVSQFAQHVKHISNP